MARGHAVFFLAMVLLMQVNPGNCGLPNLANSSSGMISAGARQVQESDFIVFEYGHSSDGYSKSMGFQPWTTTVPGNIFLILVYVAIMWFAAKLLFDGSGILVEIVSPKVTGGVFLPLWALLLDAVISIASILCGNKETAQNHKVSTGMSLLAGSTAMLLLSLLGASCIIVRKSDLENSMDEASDKDVRRFSLDGSAVSTDMTASHTARIMVISVMPFIIIQLSQILNTNSRVCFVPLISLIISIALLFAYCLHQVFHPSTLKRKLVLANFNHMGPRTAKILRCCSFERVLTANGELDIDFPRRLLEVIGENSYQFLSCGDQLSALTTGIQTKYKGSAIDDAVGEGIKDSDSCGNSRIDLDAFIEEFPSWLNKEQHPAICSSVKDLKERLSVDNSLNSALEATKKENKVLQLLGTDVVEKIENPKWRFCKAVMMLLSGSLLAAIFADPLVDCVDDFSNATNIPSFLVPFAVLPFATSSDAVSALILASQNKLRISLKFRKLHGAVSMSNLFCLSHFLGLVYFRYLTWNFTTDVLIILIVWSFLPKHM